MRSRPRLAHLTTVDMSLALLLATELEVDLEAGYDVFGISAPGSYVPAIEQLGVRHVAVPALTRAWSPADDVRAARQLAAALRRLQPDVLHTHNPKTGILGRVVGRLLGVPVVVNTCHGLWAQPDDRFRRRALVYGIEAVAALCSDAELYQNDLDRRALERVVPQQRARTVGNGVDLKRFQRDPQAGRRFRAELGIASDQLVVGGVGRLVAEKGVGEFISAAHAIGDRACFIWVGPDDDKPDRWRVPDDSVRFVGLRHDMPAVYAALDVFVLPSHREGFSRSAMEAAACGCAMVLSDIRGCREIGGHGQHLLLVPPEDAPSLARAIEALLDQPDLRARLGAAAETRARTAFDQRQVAQVSLDTYAAVAATKGLQW